MRTLRDADFRESRRDSPTCFAHLLMRGCSSLTSRAVKGTALGLHDSLDQPFFALQTGLIFAIVNLVLVLVVSFTVDRAAVGAVAQSGALFFDGFAQDSDRFLVNAFPTRFIERVAPRCG